MRRNVELQKVAEIFVGEWTLRITNQWWLDDPTTVVSGTASCEWLGESFLLMHAVIEGVPAWEFVFGRSDARDENVVLYGDERGVLRVFDLTIDGDSWEMSRSDPDFHQRFAGRVEGSRIVAQTDASDDRGVTWRKDFDLIFERSG